MIGKPSPTASRSEREAYVKQWAAITISVFALLLAINGMWGGSNSSKILSKTIEANNLWAWFQAKNVRAVIYAIAAEQNGTQSNTFDKQAIRLRSDMEEMYQKAKAAEAERDAAKNRSAYFSYAGMALQLSIVLSSAAILAVMMPMLYASAVVGFIGLYFILYAMVL